MRLLLQSGNADRAELEEQLFHIEEYCRNGAYLHEMRGPYVGFRDEALSA